jgi:hypothetical protein
LTSAFTTAVVRDGVLTPPDIPRTDSRANSSISQALLPHWATFKPGQTIFDKIYRDKELSSDFSTMLRKSASCGLLDGNFSRS